ATTPTIGCGDESLHREAVHHRHPNEPLLVPRGSEALVELPAAGSQLHVLLLHACSSSRMRRSLAAPAAVATVLKLIRWDGSQSNAAIASSIRRCAPSERRFALASRRLVFC